MGANGETLLDPCPAVTAVLAGIGGGNGNHATASVCCFAFEDGPKLCPPSIRDALSQVGVLDHVADPQIFEIDHIVLPHQQERRFVVEVGTLPTDLLVLPGEDLHGLAAAIAALHPARHPTLGLLQFPFGPAVVSGILHHVTFSRDEKHLESHIDARLLAGERQGVGGHVRAREAAIPAVSFMGDGHRLDGALKRATPPHRNAPNLGEHEAPIVKRRPVAELLVGETGVAALALETRISWLFSSLHPAKEGLECPVQPGQHILQDLGMNVLVLGSHVLDGGQFGTLVGAGDAHPALLPSVAALLESSIVEFPTAPQDECHLLLLLLSWQEFVLKGFADGCRCCLLVHVSLFWLAGTKLASRRAIHPPIETRDFLADFL
jgi:hypothetical protein